MKITQEAVNWAKAFDEKLQALRVGVSPVLCFFEEKGDESRTMAKLAELIPNHAMLMQRHWRRMGLLMR